MDKRRKRFAILNDVCAWTVYLVIMVAINNEGFHWFEGLCLMAFSAWIIFSFANGLRGYQFYVWDIEEAEEQKRLEGLQTAQKIVDGLNDITDTIEEYKKEKEKEK